MKVKKLGFILCIAAIISCQPDHHQSVAKKDAHGYPIATDVSFGNYPVGFRFFREKDYSRTVQQAPGEHQPKQVDFGLWYPAAVGVDEKLMTYRDYLIACRAPQKSSSDEIDEYIEQTSFIGELNTQQLISNLEMRTLAVEDAKPLDGKFPLVIYASRANGPVYGNSVLFEFLASQGFVVLSVPPRPADQEWESWALSNYEDACLALNKIATEVPQADINNIVTMGYELGGSAAIALSIRNQHVKGHISLNGAIGSEFGWSFSKSIFYSNLDHVKVPVMHIGTYGYEGDVGQFELIDSLHFADRYFMMLEETVPVAVSSHLVMSWILPLTKTNEGYIVNQDAIVKQYSHLLMTCMRFLDTFVTVRNDPKAFDAYIRSGSNHNLTREAVAKIDSSGL